ncbi:MAG: hypothetical protein COB20_09900 [SAR86 cluster bacterium]|uniref:Uncharacterized protein n=1 Tax=SAR86 cluster bacterium TaxID=2030880 RepID=A0A2A4X268_9GAMM|nr:MAG: hypothetical protein COB20_09900 [SAR86 cluster bacterium]
MNNMPQIFLQRVLLLSLVMSLGACHIKVRGNGFRDGQVYIGSQIASREYGAKQLAGQDIEEHNNTVYVPAGMNVQDINTVNGRVVLERGASARSVSTVNGRVQIEGRGSFAGSVDTVNGRISATQGGEIGGSATTVNGRINMDSVAVGRNVETLNGSINLVDVTVGENVETRNGNVRLENSVVEQDLIIHSRYRVSLLGLIDIKRDEPKIIVGPGSEIKGSLIARTDVRLYVHESAKIGNIVGASPLIYSGGHP